MDTRAQRGFTLIELMIVVVIATILLGIAVPSYMTQVRQSRRVEAKTMLLDMASREERYLSTGANGSQYSQTPADLGYTGVLNNTTPQGSGYYALSVQACDVGATCGAAPGPSFIATATPLGTQVNDTECGTYTVDSLGNQTASGTGGSAHCWQN
jgi:type IV pilus assembly protein PilE